MKALLTGSEVSKSIQAGLAERITALIGQGTTPQICLLRIGQKPDDIQYERSIERAFSKLHIEVLGVNLDEKATTEDVIGVMQELNTDKSVHGILMFRPLPKHIDEDKVRNSICPSKDMDGMSDASLTGILLNKQLGYAPCTAEACIRMLDYYGIDTASKNIVIIGRSNVIGKPVALLLLNKNATITICHSKTKQLPDICKQADILVCATGKPKMVDTSFVSPQQVVLDVGISVMSDGTVCGDVDFDSVAPIVDSISPVPRGVGVVTTSVLAEHLITAAEGTNDRN